MSLLENTIAEKGCKMTEDFWDPEFADQPGQPKMPVNIKEKENKFKLEVSAPGFKKKDFSISVENGQLNILAEHESEEDDGYLRKEFSRSSFSGTFSLPDNVSPDHITANYHGGVLILTLRKLARSRAIKKKVKVA